MIQYTSRVLAIPQHSVRTMLLSYYPYQFCRHQRLPLPCVGQAYDEQQTLGTNFTQIPVIHIVCRLSTYDLPVLMSLAVVEKSCHSHICNGSSSSLRSSQKYPDHISVYTDGSLRGTLCGAGYLSLLPGNFIVFSDSLSLLSALRNVHRSSHYHVYRIKPNSSNHSPQNLRWSGYRAIKAFMEINVLTTWFGPKCRAG